MLSSQQNQTDKQSSLPKRIWAFIKKAIAGLLTPFKSFFRWAQGTKFQNDSQRRSDRPSQQRSDSSNSSLRESNLAVEDPGLKSRLNSDRQRIEALQKYKIDSSKFSTNAEALMKILETAEKQYAIKQLLGRQLENFENSISQLEQSTQETIAYQKSHLTILLFQKIKEFEPLVEMIPESDKGQKTRKQAMIKELQDMTAALKRDNENVSKLSSSDQEVAYTSEKRELLINEILTRLRSIPTSVDLEKAYGKVAREVQVTEIVHQVGQEAIQLGMQAAELQPPCI